MGVEVFQLADVDLTGDGHGHHIPGTPIVFRHGWVPVDSSPGGGKKATKTRHVPKESLVTKKGSLRENRPSVFRNFQDATVTERKKLYDEAGLKLHFPDDSDEDLAERWRDPSTSPEARVLLHKELALRAKRLEVIAKGIDQELGDVRRDDRRAAISRLTDDRLRKIPGGESIIRLKDKLLSDRVLDKVEGVSEFTKTKGKDLVVHFAVTLAIASLLGPVAGVLHGAFGEEISHTVEHAMHSTFGEAGLWVTLGPKFEAAFGPIFGAFGKRAAARRLVEARLAQAV